MSARTRVSKARSRESTPLYRGRAAHGAKNASRAKRRDAPALAPANWYTDLPSADRRRAVLKYLREAVQGRAADQRNSDVKHEPGLRDIYPGFDVADGYDLRHIKSWTRAQHDRVQDAIKVVRQLLTSPYRVVKPRDKKQRFTLEHFTEQYGQRRYIVHVATPDARVRLVREKGRKHPTLQVRRPERFGGFGTLRIWMFADYNDGMSPETPEEFVSATQAMIPDMPAWGYFALWSRPNGVISIPQPRNSLVRVMQRFFLEGESFGGNKFENAVDILQGWVLQGNEDDAERVYIARQRRRVKKPNRWALKEQRIRKKQRAVRRVVIPKKLERQTHARKKRKKKQIVKRKK